MAKFEKLRISLQREEPGGVLTAVGHQESFRTREAFLVAAFAEERTFLKGRSETPLSFDPIQMPEGYAGGFFKRLRPVVLAKEDLSPYRAEHYESALAIISIKKDQFAWVQANARIGQTRILLESYLDFLLRRTNINDWRPYVRYIEVEQEYWRVIQTRKQDIARISFTFIPPNSLGGDDLIYQMVKQIQLEAHPDIQQHVYKAAPGQMEPASPLLEASARIAMKGGGTAEVKDGRGKLLYSSGQARVSEEVPDDVLPTPETPSFVSRVISRLFGQ